MEARELRIGNLVTIDNEEFWPKLKGIPFIVHSITPSLSINLDKWSYSIGLISMNEKENYVVPLYSQLIEFIEPIPLTEERLLSKYKFKEVAHRRGIQASYKKDGVRINVSNSGNCYYGSKLIPYVHNLENLYFAIKGKELKNCT
jgi:hypothetical protein